MRTGAGGGRSRQKDHKVNEESGAEVWGRGRGKIEIARCELGMRREQVEALTVVEIRELIRSHREQTKILLRPHASYPKGLSRMTAQELVAECTERGLLVGRATRPQMIAAIRAHMLTLRSDEDWLEQGAAAGSAGSPSRS
jgi:hypothetical protein